MKRQLTAWVIVAVAALGLTACSSTPTPAATTPASETTAGPTETGDGQTVAAACVELTEPLQKASETLSKVAEAPTDPQGAVDAWTALVDAYQEFTDSVGNDEVKSAAAHVTEDLRAVRDALSKVYVDGDTGALGEFTDAVTEMGGSLTELSQLCIG